MSEQLTDWNDLSAFAGLDMVREQVDGAIPTTEPFQQRTASASPAHGDTDTAGDGPGPLAPPSLSRSAYPELLARVVDAATYASEAHPIAVAANLLALFCSAIGRGPYQRIGDSETHPRPFFLLVGKSGKARKGTAEHTPREVARRADAILRKRYGTNDRLRVHSGGLSSGEGVAFAIRDPREPDENGKGGDLGVSDKRLLVIESEFANLLELIKRPGNVLSSMLRNLWDGRTVEPLTKNNQVTVTLPHVVVLGHITGHELREKSTATDAANGLHNRFIMLHVHRPKLVPHPEPTPSDVLDDLAERLAEAIHFSTNGNPHGVNVREVTMTTEARELWSDLYPGITQDRAGLAGSLMARSEVYARMLAMMFALLDMRDQIEPGDLLSAVEWVTYWRRSIEYVFLAGEEQTELDDFTKEVLAQVVAHPGIKLSALQEVWNRKRIPQVKAALETLLNLAPPLVDQRIQPGAGRPARLYYPSSSHT
jgi:putative DNA primase/helicase